MYRKNYWVYLLFALVGCREAILAAQDPEETKDEEVHVDDKPKHYFFLAHKAKEKDQFEGQLYLPDYLERKVAHAVSSLESLSAEEQVSEVKEKEIILCPNFILCVSKNLSKSEKDYGFRFKKTENEQAKVFLVRCFAEGYHAFCSNKRIIKGSRAGIEKSLNNQGVMSRFNVGSLLPIYYRFLGYFNCNHEYYKNLVIHEIMSVNFPVVGREIRIFVFTDTGDDNKPYKKVKNYFMYGDNTRFKDLLDHCNDRIISDSIQIDKIGFLTEKSNIDRQGGGFYLVDLFFEHSKDAAQRSERLTMRTVSWKSFENVAKDDKNPINEFKKFNLAKNGFLLFLFGKCIKQA